MEYTHGFHPDGQQCCFNQLLAFISGKTSMRQERLSFNSINSSIYIDLSQQIIPLFFSKKLLPNVDQSQARQSHHLFPTGNQVIKHPSGYLE